MCVGENNALQAVNYVNAQLTALHQNAVECLVHHGSSQKSEDQYRYSHALAQFYFGKYRSKNIVNPKTDTMFFASFGVPRLDFICNHDAILRIKIREGHYHLDHTKTLTYADSDRIQSISDVEVVCRVGFEVRGIRGKDSKIGNGQNLIQMIVLDLQRPEIVSVSPDFTTGRDAFTFYVTKYLEFLHHAGNHVLFSLPDFDDDRFRLTIDYSLMGSPLLPLDDVHGTSVEKINTYLSSAWLKAAMLAGSPSGHPAAWQSICLAEYQSHWTIGAESNVHFHLRLGAPHIQPVCSREVVMYFNIDEVLFYDGTDFAVTARQRYTGWQIAVLVNVINEVESEGNVTRCKLDISTAQVYHHFCAFPGLDELDDDAMAFYSYLIEFFSSDYLEILESSNFHVIYHYDHRWSITHNGSFGAEYDDNDDDDVSWGKDDELDVHGSAHGHSHTHTRVTTWKEVITSSNMYGFDQIVAISQASLNAYFNSMFIVAQGAKTSDYTAALSKWSYDQYFQAKFKPVTVRLLSNGKAIIWFHLEEGYLKTLRNWQPWSESKQYDFEEWRLAFEVDLKMTSHDELEDVCDRWRTKFEDSLAFKAHGNREDRYLKHIYLDLQNAEFVHEYSSFDGLFQSQNSHPIDKVQAVVHYLRFHYFPYLRSWGLNILHTVPVWKSGTSLGSYALTDVAFHVYSKVDIHRQNWAQVSPNLEPIIVILGMTGFKPLPSRRLQFSTNWVVRANKSLSHGTVAVARQVFMDERLLNLLAKINTVTTIVPLFSGVENGVWKLELTTWGQHPMRRNRPCKWEAVSERDGHLKYKWQHRDGWSYEHEGTSDIPNGAYSVSCLTKNFVELPTAFRKGALEIKVWGEVNLEMSFKTHKDTWSTKSSAKWEIVLAVVTDVSGIKVTVTGSSVPQFEKSEVNHESASAMFTDPETLLKAHLPGTIDINEIVQELKAFEGIWQFCFPGMKAYALANPTFNVRGDLLFELKPYGVHAHAAGGAASTARASSSSFRGTLGRPSAVRPPSLYERVKEFASTAYTDVVANGNGNGHSPSISRSVSQSNGNGNGHSAGYSNGATYAAKTATKMEITSSSTSYEEVEEEESSSQVFVEA